MAPTFIGDFALKGSTLREKVCTSGETCICLRRSGCTRESLVDGHLLKTELDGPIFECDSNCACDENCANSITRGLDRNPKYSFEVISCLPAVGVGLITKTAVVKGDFVIEYVGEYIDKQEAFKRIEKSVAGRTYLLNFKEHFGPHKVVITSVDAEKFGNESRLINHSCSPNLVVLPVRNPSGVEVPRLCLFALRNIEAGEELTYSYGSDESTVSNKPCFCGSSDCRGFLPFDKI